MFSRKGPGAGGLQKKNWWQDIACNNKHPFLGIMSIFLLIQLMVGSYTAKTTIPYLLYFRLGTREGLKSLFFNIYFYLFIHLAAPGLTYGMQDLIPIPRIEPGPPHISSTKS